MRCCVSAPEQRTNNSARQSLNVEDGQSCPSKSQRGGRTILPVKTCPNTNVGPGTSEKNRAAPGPKSLELRAKSYRERNDRATSPIPPASRMSIRIVLKRLVGRK